MSDETQSADSKPEKDTAATEGAELQNTFSGDNPISKDENLDNSEEKNGKDGKDGVDDSPQPFDRSLLENGVKEENPQNGDEPLPQQKSTQISQAEKQVHTWHTRVVNGEVNIEDETMPEWVRTRVKAMIDSELDEIDNAYKENTLYEDIRKKVLHETRFERLIEALPVDGMPPSEQKKLANEAKRLEDLGMDRLDAWSEAINRLNIHQKAEERGAKAAMMYVPDGGILVDERGKKQLSKGAIALSKNFGLTEEDIKKFSPK